MVKELTLDAAVENVPVVTEFIETELEAFDCSMAAQIKFNICIDEIFSNIAFYAYGDQGGQASVRLEVFEDSREAQITFVDSGTPFNPLEQEAPDITAPAEEREIGGLGILMVKKSMDSVTYENKDGRNILTIRRKI